MIKNLEIMNENKEMCKEHTINFVDYIHFFIKSRVILIKEKIWNYYKLIEDSNLLKKITINDLMNYLQNDLNQVTL